MARLLRERYVLKGTLECLTPLSIAGAAGGIIVDMLVTRDGEGRPYIPGTSIAGSVRSFLDDLAKGDVWGGAGDKDAASLIRFADAPVIESRNLEVRDGIVIDRETGATAETYKFNREVIPAGTTFDFEVTVEVPSQADDAKRRHLKGLLHAIQKAMETSAIHLGGLTGRGLGRVKLRNGAVSRADLATKDGLLSLLKQGPVGAPLDESEIEALELPSNLAVTLDWEPVGALMVKSGIDGVVVDTIPLLSSTKDEPRQVIPGSSIKGVLRSLAERIMRTLIPETASKMPEALSTGANDLVAVLFGIPRPDDKSAPRRSGVVPGRGAVSVADVYASDSVNSSVWFADRQEPSLPATGKYKAAQHVAIDRWTGGAADSKLFSAVEPWGITFGPIVVEVSSRRLAAAGKHEKAAIALLLLTLREFATACPGLGFGSTRGYGSIKVKSVAFEVLGNAPATAMADLKDITLGGEMALDGVAKHYQAQWSDYLAAKGVSA